MNPDHVLKIILPDFDDVSKLTTEQRYNIAIGALARLIQSDNPRVPSVYDGLRETQRRLMNDRNLLNVARGEMDTARQNDPAKIETARKWAEQQIAEMQKEQTK